MRQYGVDPYPLEIPEVDAMSSTDADGVAAVTYDLSYPGTIIDEV